MPPSSTAGAGFHLVQLLLPLRDDEGHPFPAAWYASLRARLTERFGGLTAYTRAPAQGLWTDGDGPPQRDDIVVYEVMAPSLDRAWWGALRRSLEERFAQDELVIRTHPMERL
ncbi:MAG: hypothetical protein JWL60_1761 [Gemmatimonadetes bacterium]|nr:hypothetical protein [Gemmatimonadota bacterium]